MVLSSCEKERAPTVMVLFFKVDFGPLWLAHRIAGTKDITWLTVGRDLSQQISIVQGVQLNCMKVLRADLTMFIVKEAVSNYLVLSFIPIFVVEAFTCCAF
jgi:hypothetical protein